MPAPEFEVFYQEIAKAKKRCVQVKKEYVDRFCECNSPKDAGFPVLQMNIGQGADAKWVKMTGEDYLLWDPLWKDCMLRITDDFTLTSAWMFGIPFLQAYYAIHDLEDHRIGLVRINKDTE